MVLLLFKPAIRLLLTELLQLVESQFVEYDRTERLSSGLVRLITSDEEVGTNNCSGSYGGGSFQPLRSVREA